MRFQIVHRNEQRIRVKSPFLCTFSVREYIKDLARSCDGLKLVDFYSDERHFAITVKAGASIQVAVAFLRSIDSTTIKHCLSEPYVKEETPYSLISKSVVQHGLRQLLLPLPLRYCYTFYKASSYVTTALSYLKQKQLNMDVLDGSAILVSILMGQIKTASTIMFIMGLGEELDAWSSKKSIEDLEKGLKNKKDQVWLVDDSSDRHLVDSSKICVGDVLVFGEGQELLFDGEVISGKGMVNESSLTGEFFPIDKCKGNEVYSNTVIESGELIIKVTNAQQNSRVYELIRLMKEAECQTDTKKRGFIQLADKLVKYNFLGMALTYLLTRSLNKALSFLLVDFSCALKLSTPITYLSAIKEASERYIIIKDSSVLEVYPDIDTFVFDKTGTLTVSAPTVYQTIPFHGYSRKEVLRISACLEEHFHHPLASAVVQKAADEGIIHEEMHGDLNYIASRGVKSSIDGEQVVIGSYLFMIEEGITVTPEQKVIIDDFKNHFNLLYLGYKDQLIAVFLIDTPLRPEITKVLQALKKQGKELVLLTGDSHERTIQVMANLPFDDIRTQVSPSDKFDYIQSLKNAGKKVMMLGDGLNDSAAISSSDIGVVMGESADISKQTSDVILVNNNLSSLLELNNIVDVLEKSISRNVYETVTINSGLILLGIFNLLPPSPLSILHNATTTRIILKSLSVFKRN